jgi:hypothetical protein
LSPQGTLVVLMGVNAWPAIQKKLLVAGWSASKPIAAIESGTWSTQREVLTTLARSVDDFHRAHLAAPAVIVVGEVARLGKKFNWLRQQKPLLGKKVVVTRGVHQNFEMTAFLEEKGHEVFYPSRDLNEHTDTSGFNSVIEKIDAMAEADAVHVIWDDQYKNSYFELGVAMSLSKSIHFVKAIYPDITNVPTYQKVIQMWELSSAEE